MPSLRCRDGDIRLLFEHFIDVFAKRHHMRRPSVESEVLPFLAQYAWPGNVRELKCLCERLVIFGTDPITADQLPSSFFGDASAPETGLLNLAQGQLQMTLKEFKTRCEKEYIESLLQRTRWNISAAARILDIQRTYLHQKIGTLGLRRPGVGEEEEVEAATQARGHIL